MNHIKNYSLSVPCYQTPTVAVGCQGLEVLTDTLQLPDASPMQYTSRISAILSPVSFPFAYLEIKINATINIHTQLQKYSRHIPP